MKKSSTKKSKREIEHANRSNSAKRYWNRIRKLQKKLSGNDADSKLLRKQALRLYNVKINSFPKLKQIRRLQKKMSDNRKRFKKNIIQSLESDYADYGTFQEAQLDRYANAVYKDTEEGKFEGIVYGTD